MRTPIEIRPDFQSSIVLGKRFEPLDVLSR